MASILKRSASSSSSAQLGPGLPADFTGCYELHSVVTHKGRSADSGHYMGYVRQGSSNQWWCFNDEKVLTDVTTADVLLLCGGGDRDIAYLTFYKFKASRK
jgi:ubiquitin carboxyl-terminal hydrolase 14